MNAAATGTPGHEGTGGGTTDGPIAWPVLVIGRDDRFVHVLDERGLSLHHDGPGRPDSPDGGHLLRRGGGGDRGGGGSRERAAEPDDDGSAVDVFDRDGRRLRPVLGQDSTFEGLEPTGVLVPFDVLLARLDRAVRWARTEMDTRGVAVVVAPRLPKRDYPRYLDELTAVFEAQPGNGSSFHNFMHLIT